jgi:hypothetical protein
VLPTIAAFIAAGAAVIAAAVNVLLTALFTRRATLETWRRDRIHPLVVSMQAASYRHETKSWTLIQIRRAKRNRDLSSDAREEMLREPRKEASAAYEEMTVTLAELELVAPSSLVQAARELHKRHIAYAVAEDFNPDAPYEEIRQWTSKAEAARNDFVSVARQVLGVAEGRRGPWLRRPGWLQRHRGPARM